MLSDEARLLLDIIREELKNLRSDFIVNRNEVNILDRVAVTLRNDLQNTKDEIEALNEVVSLARRGFWNMASTVINGVFLVVIAIITFFKH